ncbi:aminotransferase class I/II-fold pyridoxal phosphate-dependent enzyme [Sphingomonas crocodyli]|uniref:Pyridoxal phosphate-dependent class II aminotransferase n=1 Tax=Sphingomonas crocodyli TaxID=1979270 RepID=A0A437LZZ2_9SPHN|nr:aminotransferase class I/II-fold pyridoxal phosphate-dependent enzyme [Sphingomonas crocodyli]RVT91001.1 pyridoxal phosphate-dependent class II aminotransferase [Sphingomonas crocodyli]
MSDRWTWHGGGLTAARAHYGDGDWIDLSTGINPHPWAGVDALTFDWQRLPDESGLRDLEVAAAAHFGAEPAYVCAVPGSEIGLRLTGQLLGESGLWAEPAYRTHGDVLRDARPLPFDRIDAADGRSLILANPNNPDGRLIDRAAMRDLLARRGEGWLLIDEAFADAHSECSLVGEVGDRRLIVFRSFGKFFGLAGVRLGFVIGPRAIVDRLRALIGAWPLSAAAVAIGAAAYRDRDWIDRTGPLLRNDAAALDRLLCQRGYVPQGACPLFRLIETKDARDLFERLAMAKILTRPFAEHPRWLRIGLPGGADELARLDAALGGV